ncbi:MAG TPA: 30S ribosomal protein S16 [Ktedonobacterales bacterium]
MVKIRLMRVGSKGAPVYRVVVADSRSPRDGRIIENIGIYNPRTEPATVTIEQERAKYWLSVGAQPSDSARQLLERIGVLDRANRPKGSTPAQPKQSRKAVKAASAE